MKADEMAELEEKKPPNYSIRPLQIYALVGYYIVMIVGSVALLVFSILKEESEGVHPILPMLGFLASGAIVGSILYQIQMLFRYYIKTNDFDPRWLGKYVSAPWEAVALAVAVLSLIQGGGVVLGGQHFSVTKGNGFVVFGFGALIGFGIREVLGWLGNIVKTMFPT